MGRSRALFTIVLLVIGDLSFAGNVDWLADPRYDLTEDQITRFEDLYYDALEDTQRLYHIEDLEKFPVVARFLLQIANETNDHTGVLEKKNLVRYFEASFKSDDPSKVFSDEGEYILNSVYGDKLPDFTGSVTPFGFLDNPVDSDSPFIRELQRSISYSSWSSPFQHMIENPEKMYEVQEQFLERLPLLSEEDKTKVLGQLLEEPYPTSAIYIPDTLGGFSKRLEHHAAALMESPLLPEIAEMAFHAFQEGSDDSYLNHEFFNALTFNPTYRQRALNIAASTLLNDSEDDLDTALAGSYISKMLALDEDERLQLDQELHTSLALQIMDPLNTKYDNFMTQKFVNDTPHYLVATLGLDRVLENLANKPPSILRERWDHTTKSAHILNTVWDESRKIIVGGMPGVPHAWVHAFDAMSEQEIRRSVLESAHDFYDLSKDNNRLFDILSWNASGLLSNEEQFEYLLKYEADEDSIMNFRLLTWTNKDFENPEILTPLLEKHLDALSEETLVEIHQVLKENAPTTVIASLFSSNRLALLVGALKAMIAEGRHADLALDFIQTHVRQFRMKDLVSLVEHVATFQNREKATFWTQMLLSKIEEHPELLEEMRKLLEKNPDVNARISKLFSELAPGHWGKLIPTYLIPQAVEELNKLPLCPTMSEPLLEVERPEEELPHLAFSPKQKRHLFQELRSNASSPGSFNIFEKVIKLWTDDCRRLVHEKYDTLEEPDELGRESKVEELHNIILDNMQQLILGDYWESFEYQMENCHEPNCTELVTEKLKSLAWQIPQTVSRMETRLPGKEGTEDTFPAACTGKDPVILLNEALNASL